MSKLVGILSLVLSAVLLPLTPATSAHASGFWNCDSEPLTSFWEEDVGFNELSGRGTVCATPLGLWSTMQVRGLTPGNAYTTWWVYIDDPESCINFPLPQGFPLPDGSKIPFDEPAGYAGRCGLADFGTPDPSGEFANPLGVFGRMDSVVARRKHRTRFAGDLRSFSPSSGSQVWLFLFGHGPADESDKRQLARQLLTPEDPASGTPHVGIEGRPFGYPAGVVVIDIP